MGCGRLNLRRWGKKCCERQHTWTTIGVEHTWDTMYSGRRHLCTSACASRTMRVMGPGGWDPPGPNTHSRIDDEGVVGPFPSRPLCTFCNTLCHTNVTGLQFCFIVHGKPHSPCADG